MDAELEYGGPRCQEDSANNLESDRCQSGAGSPAAGWPQRIATV